MCYYSFSLSQCLAQELTHCRCLINILFNDKWMNSNEKQQVVHNLLQDAIFFLKNYLFILVVLSLRCFAEAFSVAESRGSSLFQCSGFSLWWLLLLQSTGSRHIGSVVVMHRLSCSAAWGIFLDQGLNLCPLHWQVDSNHCTIGEVPQGVIFFWCPQRCFRQLVCSERGEIIESLLVFVLFFNFPPLLSSAHLSHSGCWHGEESGERDEKSLLRVCVIADFLDLADVYSCSCPSTKHHGELLWVLQGFPAGPLSCTPLSKGISTCQWSFVFLHLESLYSSRRLCWRGPGIGLWRLSFTSLHLAFWESRITPI